MRKGEVGRRVEVEGARGSGNVQNRRKWRGLVMVRDGRRSPRIRLGRRRQHIPFFSTDSGWEAALQKLR